MALVNQGRWDELCEQCKGCVNLRLLSARMELKDSYYSCGKYPLRDSNKVCPKFKRIEE